MKYLFLFIFLSYPLHAMKIKENKPSVATLKCLQGIKDFNKTMVKEAFSEGADVNYVDEEGNSLFSLAAADRDYNLNTIKKNVSVLKLLVSQKNIDPFTRNFNNCTPLHMACQFGIIDTIKEILKKAPAVLTYQTKQGFTPLHAAVYFNQMEAINLLLSHDKKIINAQDYEGRTPLHIACVENDLNTISLLINNGACTTIKNNSQQTPLYMLHSTCFPQDYPVDTLSSEKLETFLKDNPSIAEKLIHATDEHNNNQFHLCATLNLDGYRVFQRYLHFLVTKKISMHSRNKDDKRPIDLIYDEYLTSYNQYIFRKTELQKKILVNAEKNMHAFLRFISPFTESILWKIMLEKKDKYKQPLLREIKNYIAYLYYALNIETIIANKNIFGYYENFIENKMAIKQQLIQNPEPHLLWSSY